jgi:hypothetical protein
MVHDPPDGPTAGAGASSSPAECAGLTNLPADHGKEKAESSATACEFSKT